MVKSDGLKLLETNENYVALAIVDAEKYQETNLKIIKELIKKSLPGVYVTLNLPYEDIKNKFIKQKVNLNNVIFIDAVTKTAGGKIKKTKDCLYIGSPKNLSDISIAMDQAIMAIPAEDKFLFFDSLSTLLLYNDVKVVAKFIHFLSGKMRIWKVKGIIISLRREKDKELINELKAYCDLTLNL
ncbi:MAG: hypothetical protein KJ597_00615 [Nanoarchaeota archaeon]|nr:hypothetical protein [Nanoarchaeota archaeon]MBU1622055.1 hypothetical protein [Nanoarchaeota archaeon]